MNLIFIILFLVMEFFTWIVVHLLCEYKYFWCKGNCASCYNWRCKFFNKYDHLSSLTTAHPEPSPEEKEKIRKLLDEFEENETPE